MSVKLLTEHNLEFLSLKADCTGLSESTLVKMPHCWKSDHRGSYYDFSLLRSRMHACARVYMRAYYSVNDFRELLHQNF